MAANVLNAAGFVAKVNELGVRANAAANRAGIPNLKLNRSALNNLDAKVKAKRNVNAALGMREQENAGAPGAQPLPMNANARKVMVKDNLQDSFNRIREAFKNTLETVVALYLNGEDLKDVLSEGDKNTYNIHYPKLEPLVNAFIALCNSFSSISKSAITEAELNQLKDAQITPLVVDAEALVALTDLAGIPGAVQNLTDKIGDLVAAASPAALPAALPAVLPAAPAGAQVAADHSAEEKLYDTARDQKLKVKDRLVALNKLIDTGYFKSLDIDYKNAILQLRTALEGMKNPNEVSILIGGRRRKTKGKGKKSTKRRMPKAKGKRKTKAKAQAKATRKNRRS